MARKIDWDKVLTPLKTTCGKCGRVIRPNEIKTAHFERMICPACGAILNPLEKRNPDPSPQT